MVKFNFYWPLINLKLLIDLKLESGIVVKQILS